MSSASPPSSETTAAPESAGRIRDDGRNARLSFKNFAEHQIRSEFKEEALTKCKPEIGAFAGCAREKGLMVVISCRKFNRAITDCMYRHNSDEKFAEFLEAHPGIIEKRTIQSFSRG
jgi:hypothetical protein